MDCDVFSHVLLFRHESMFIPYPAVNDPNLLLDLFSSVLFMLTDEQISVKLISTKHQVGPFTAG